MSTELRLVRCRWVFAIWAISFVMSTAASLVVGLMMNSINGYWASATLMYVAHAGIAFGLYLACRSHGIRVRQLVGPVPPVNMVFGSAITALPVLLSSLGGAWLISLIAPNVFQFFVTEAMKARPVGALQAVLTLCTFVVVAPLLEEFTFRGLLFTRLSVKYSPWKAAVISSLMFGLVHVDLIGAFVFGLVATMLYARTKSLIAPIVLHSMNNLIAFSGYLFDSSDTSIPTWVGLLGLFAGIPVCAYLVARWGKLSIVPPYIAASGGEQGA
jgi:uncharacterized protein